MFSGGRGVTMRQSGYYHLIYEILLITHFDLKQRARKGG